MTSSSSWEITHSLTHFRFYCGYSGSSNGTSSGINVTNIFNFGGFTVNNTFIPNNTASNTNRNDDNDTTIINQNVSNNNMRAFSNGYDVHDPLEALRLMLTGKRTFT
jgi:hypothetical protein